MKPISPMEAVSIKAASLPDDVIDEWNKAIAEAFQGNSATVVQAEMATRLAKRMGVDRNVVFDRHWLDVEDMYRAAGWHVEYDKPGYNESYKAFFTFTPKGHK